MNLSTWADLVSFFNSHTVSQYERQNWDAFLSHQHFQYAIPSVHITGTNGKGSTALKIAQTFQEAGYQVGLYTSPSILSYTEMIQINGQPISETIFLQLVNEFLPLFLQFRLTTFEMQTYIAFMYFLRKECTFSVIEVGMGGLTDATNVFTPSLSIITNVTLEHQAYLGSTHEAIATQKSGIIKPNIPVIVGPAMNPKALHVIQQIAQQKGSKLYQSLPLESTMADEGLVVKTEDDSFLLSTHALYQKENAATMIQAIDVLSSTFKVQRSHLQKAFGRSWLPGRFEKIHFQGHTIILDGAHNPGAIKELIHSLPQPPHHVLFACFKDKDLPTMVELMKQAKWSMTFSSFAHPRARNKGDYPHEWAFIEDPFLALKHVLKNTPLNGVILITGSLAFIGIMRSYLRG